MEPTLTSWLKNPLSLAHLCQEIALADQMKGVCRATSSLLLSSRAFDWWVWSAGSNELSGQK